MNPLNSDKRSSVPHDGGHVPGGRSRTGVQPPILLLGSLKHLQKWRQEIATYKSLRQASHNFFVLCGLVETNALHAFAFHNELVPYGQFLSRFQHSTVLTTYILGCWFWCDGCGIDQNECFRERKQRLNERMAIVRMENLWKQ
ncbi:hypothetical protein B0H14DRAFT_2601130 [Mycena olivaceomarginata]|nr:hypothetical protein B0H14DRAFT_2601130 [Mycena olivaceomarginata]